MGLKRVMLDANLLDSYEQVSPLRTKAKFQAESWPSGAEWQALTPEDRQLLIKLASGSILLQPYKAAFSRADIGRVIYEDHNERAAAWAKKQTDATWSAISPHYDDTARVKWLKQFDEKIKAAHYEPLAKFEDDWRAAADDMQTMAYFKEHFDPEDPNDPLKLHSPGKVYGQENQYINTPAPITNGAALDTYLKLLDKPITDDTAIILRSLAGNQQSIIALVNTQLSGDSGADSKDGGGLRDKTYDFVKGLRSEVKALHQYSWLSNTLAAFSVGQLTALSSATLSAISRNTNVSGALFHKLQTLQNLWGMQQALDLIAMQGALTGAAPKMPVLITMRVDIDEALAVMNARKGQGIDVSKSRIKQLRRTHSKIALTLLTDTDSIKTAQGDLKTLSNDASTGQVKMGGSATTSAAASAGSTIILSEEHFMRLYASQSNLGGRAANAIRLSLTKGSGADIRAIAMGADGRLAIGSVVVQSIGLYYGITGFLKASGEGNTQGMRDACYGLYDSAAGGLSGLMEIWSVAVSARTIANAASAEAGKSAVAKSIGLGAMRLATNIAGIAGGAINTIASLDKATDAIALGDKKIAALFNGSAAMFAGLTVTATLTTIGTGAEMLAVRSVGGAAVEAVAIRLGAGGVASLLGISITGWGLIFLGLGIGAQVTAIALTPTPMQRWVGRSYFGRDSSFFSANSKRDDMFKKGDWKAELEGLQAALKEAGAQVPETEAPSPKTQVTQ